MSYFFIGAKLKVQRKALDFLKLLVQKEPPLIMYKQNQKFTMEEYILQYVRVKTFLK